MNKQVTLNQAGLVERLEAVLAAIEKPANLYLHPTDREKYFELNDHLHLFRDLKDYISHHRADGWQPIESAPKDGTRILGAWKGDNWNVLEMRWTTLYHNNQVLEGQPEEDARWIGLCWRTGESRWDGNFGRPDWSLTQPTHWQELPAPPTQAPGV